MTFYQYILLTSQVAVFIRLEDDVSEVDLVSENRRRSSCKPVKKLNEK